MEDYSETLRKCELFSKLDEASMRILQPGCLWLRLNANDMLFHEGSPGGSLYVVCSGEVAIERIRYRGDDKQDVVFYNSLKPYQVIGELSLFEEGRRTASARATVDRTNLLMVDGKYVLSCMERSPGMAIGLLKAVMAKLEQLMGSRSEQQVAPVRIRLAKMLCELMESDGAPTATGAMELKNVVTQAELARRLGCSRETVCKELKDLGTDVVTSTRGRLKVHKPKKLVALAERPY